MNTRLAIPALWITAVAVTLLAADDAAACFNVTQAEVDAVTKKVKAAEAALEKEDQTSAHKLAEEALHFLRSAKMATHPDGKLRSPNDKPVDPPDPGLLARAHRIDTLALSRAARTSAEDRVKAADRFEAEVLKGANDPSLTADHAELLSRVPARVGQAAMMLRALRDKDLIGSAHAYLALAKLEKADGNAEAEKTARDRCRAAALKKAICDL